MHLEELEDGRRLPVGLGQSHSYWRYNVKRSRVRVIFEMMGNALLFETKRSQDYFDNMQTAPR